MVEVAQDQETQGNVEDAVGMRPWRGPDTVGRKKVPSMKNTNIGGIRELKFCM
jgi:hypothetical protein